MKYSKIGTELAYALLMSSFDAINEQRKNTFERHSIIQHMIEQITSSSSDSIAVTPKFGLTTPPINSCIELSEDESDDENDEVTDSQFTEILDKVKVLSQIVEEIKRQGINRAIFNERYLPFMNSATSLFFRRESDSDNIRDDFERHTNMQAYFSRPCLGV